MPGKRILQVKTALRGQAKPTGVVHWSALRSGGLFILLLAGLPQASIRAQNVGGAAEGNSTTQASEVSSRSGQSANEGSAPSASPAIISGTVQDERGVGIGGAKLTVVDPGHTMRRVTTTDSRGDFEFHDLPAGTYEVSLDTPGLNASPSGPIVLAGGDRRQLTVVATRLAVQKTTVDVHATLNQVAQAQVHEQEEQRIFGFLPNYYTSYIWNAAPMTPKLKFKLALRTNFDPVTFLTVAGIAGAEQQHNTFPGYGRGAEGYGKRYGATYADTLSGRILGSAVFPTLLHQDPRYFYQGSGTIRSRFWYALVSALVCRGDDGQREPNYSRILSSFTAAGLSNVYRAPEDRQASLTFRNGLIIIAGGAVENVLREFLSRKLTPNVPAFAAGKPAAGQSSGTSPARKSQ